VYQWARIVLVVERGVSPAERLKKLTDYSQPMSDGRRALVLRLNQTVSTRKYARLETNRSSMSMILTFLGGGQGGDEGDTRDEENPRQIAEEKAEQNVKGEDSI